MLLHHESSEVTAKVQVPNWAFVVNPIKLPEPRRFELAPDIEELKVSFCPATGQL